MAEGQARVFDGDFLRFLVGETVSDLGDQITLVAIPLTAVLALGASPFQMGLLAAAGTLPTPLFSLVAGVWVDRVRRRPVLIAADIGRAIALVTIPIAFVLGALTLIHLYVVAFIAGTLSVFFLVAYQAYLPSLVAREQLVVANGRMNAAASAAQLAGPGVAGVLVQLFTAPMPVVVDALSFLASVVGIASIRRVEPAPTPRPRDVRREIAEGMRALLAHPTLRALVLGNSVIILCYSAQLAIFLLFLARDVALEPSVIGVVLAIGGIGSLLGALFAGRVAQAVGIGPAFIWAAIVATIAFAGRAAFTTPLELAMPAIAAGQFVALFCASIFNVNGPSLRQAMTPPHLLGRVNASYRFIVWGTGPVGALLGGALAQAVGAQGALLIAGVGFLGALPIYMLSPLPHMRTLPAGTAQA